LREGTYVEGECWRRSEVLGEGTYVEGECWRRSEVLREGTYVEGECWRRSEVLRVIFGGVEGGVAPQIDGAVALFLAE
jgi:hypothetical protein